MAVDRKADYVGNHGGAYTDETGMSRQFTYVDHDKKLKISPRTDTPFNKEWDALEQQVINNPIFTQYLEDNELEWGLNVNLGHLREIKKLIDGQLQKKSNRKNK